MEGLSLLANYLNIGGFPIAQTLMTALGTTVLFLLFVLLYAKLKKRRKVHMFVFCVESVLEKLMDFIHDT